MVTYAGLALKEREGEEAMITYSRSTDTYWHNLNEKRQQRQKGEREEVEEVTYFILSRVLKRRSFFLFTAGWQQAMENKLKRKRSCAAYGSQDVCT